MIIYRDGFVTMIMTVVMVVTSTRSVKVNITLAPVQNLLARISNVFVRHTDAMVRMTVVIILMSSTVLVSSFITEALPSKLYYNFSKNELATIEAILIIRYMLRTI